MLDKAKPKGKGVRALGVSDRLPDAEICINGGVYQLAEVCANKKVADIGCGYGRNRKLVESVGGEWVGVEPFEGGGHTVTANAEDLPFEDESFDVVVMDAVLEHIPDVGAAISETARILKPGGCFVGYAAYMECFHEISYSHLSFMALEHYSKINGLKLERIGGARRFGIDYHLGVLLYPLPCNWLRGLIAMGIRGTFRTKAAASYVMLRLLRGVAHQKAKEKAERYYVLECFRQSNGFSYLIRKPVA
jgi:SAM-dependent methyltransferase